MNISVYEVLKTIPEGKVVTYGQIAEFLGNKHLARVVGNVLHKNPDPEHIPCHRVVNRKANFPALMPLEVVKHKENDWKKKASCLRTMEPWIWKNIAMIYSIFEWRN